MLFLYIFIALLLTALIYMRFEASFVEVKRVRFSKSDKGLKIIQLSDIHISRLKVSPKKIRELIRQESPDIIVMTGDYIENEEHIPMFYNFLEEIGAGKDCFLTLGNHDYKVFNRCKEEMKDFIDSIESRGSKFLNNNCVSYEKNSRKYNIVGIADIRYGHHNIDEAFRNCDGKADINIAFSHNPDLALELPKGKVDYLFCGHYHGGQIWAPFNLEFRLLRKDILCKKGIKSGLHKVNGINLYINRGLGNVSVPFRFLSRPEITIIHFP